MNFLGAVLTFQIILIAVYLWKESRPKSLWDWLGISCMEFNFIAIAVLMWRGIGVVNA